MKVDQLAQMIREVDGRHDLGAGALAEALLPKIAAAIASAPAESGERGDGLPALWVNAAALADKRNIGINAVRADHQDRKNYTIPLYTTPQPPSPISDEAEYPEAAQVCAEAYQVVGCLLSDLGIFDTDRAEKILDNLSQHRKVHDDVLPWPSMEQPPTDSSQRGGGLPEPIAHRWLRNGEVTQTGWIDGVPSKRQFEAQENCKDVSTWTVEYAYAQQCRSARVEVTDEMVERAIEAFEANDGGLYTHDNKCRIMREALTAALNPEPK